MAASSSGAFIRGLFPEVRAMVDALPPAEQETFSYLASVDHQNHHQQQQQQQQQHKKHGNASKGKSGSGLNEAHEHRCNCFGCYTKHWELWAKSKYSEEITNALIAYENLLAQEQGSSSRRTQWHVGGKKESSSKEKLKRGNKDSSSNHKGKAKNRGGKESKAAGTPPPTSASVVVPKEHGEGEAAAVAPAGDTVPKEEKVSHDKKSMKKQQQQQKDAEVKPEQQQQQPPAPPVSKPRSKQVAPLDFKEDLAAEESVVMMEEGIAESSLAAGKPQQSFGNRASETLGFVCDKLLGMWYPRLRRRN